MIIIGESSQYYSGLINWAVRQLYNIGRDFLENTQGVASFALAVGSSAEWLDHEARSKRKHTKALPITCWTAQYEVCCLIVVAIH